MCIAANVTTPYAAADTGEYREAVPMGAGPAVATPGTDPTTIEKVKALFERPTDAAASGPSVTNANSAQIRTPGEIPAWADGVAGPEVLAAIPTARAIVPLPVGEIGDIAVHPCCFGAPAPLLLGEATATSSKGHNGCLFELASDTPGADRGDTRNITFGLSVDCGVGWLHGTGQARLTGVDFNEHLAWAPQFGFRGPQTAWGFTGYTREEDTQMQILSGWLNMSIDDTSSSAGFTSVSATGGLQCDRLFAKVLKCWFHTPYASSPTAFLPKFNHSLLR